MPHTSSSSISGLGLVLDDSGNPRASPVRSRASQSSAKRARAATVGAVEPALRSSMRMNGLLSAETGGTMVRLDPSNEGSGFEEGSPIDLEEHRRDSTIKASKLPPALRRSSSFSLPNPHRGGSTRSDVSESVLSIGSTPSMSLSSRNSSQAIELDLVLENSTAVEGSSLNGYVVLRTSKHSPNLRLGPGKIRVVGFEAVPSDRHTFYQHSAPLESTCPTLHTIFAPTRNSTSTFREIIDGKHVLPFSFHLPRLLGAKGSVISRSRVNVRYIALVSFKYRDGTESSKPESKQLVHFYRACHIFPYFDPARAMNPSPTPIARASAKSLFMGGDGKISLKCALHRSMWVAGQQCWVGIRVQNKTTKRVKTLTLAIHRQTTTFRIDPRLNPGGAEAEVDIDSCETSVSRKKLVEIVLESGVRGGKGAVTGKGWWCGVDAKAESQVTHGIPIPSDALTIPRSRLLEISYTLKVTANTGSLTSDVCVELPITIVNFISLYPPPQPPSFRPIELTLHSNPNPVFQRIKGNGRDRAKSIPLKAGMPREDEDDERVTNGDRRPPLRSQVSMPEARFLAVTRGQGQGSHPPNRDRMDRSYEAQGQVDEEDSDVDEIADVLQSARLDDDFADEDYVQVPSSTSTYQGDLISSIDARSVPSSSEFDSYDDLRPPLARVRPQSNRSDHKGSRRLPSPPPPLRASRSSDARAAPAAPAGPRVRAQSRAKLPSAFLSPAPVPAGAREPQRAYVEKQRVRADSKSSCDDDETRDRDGGRREVEGVRTFNPDRDQSRGPPPSDRSTTDRTKDPNPNPRSERRSSVSQARPPPTYNPSPSPSPSPPPTRQSRPVVVETEAVKQEPIPTRPLTTATSLHNLASGPNGVVGLGVPALHAMGNGGGDDPEPSPSATSSYTPDAIDTLISERVGDGRKSAPEGKPVGKVREREIEVKGETERAKPKPRMPASTSIKARIAQLERAGLNR